MIGFLCVIFLTDFAVEAQNENLYRMSDKIVGGFDAPEGSAPYQVSVQIYQGRAHCGGSILNEKSVLTAAHCTTDLNAASVVEYATEHIGYGKQVGIKSAVNHPGYVLQLNSKGGIINIQHDIALLFVQGSMVLDGKAKAIILNRSPIAFGARGIVTGFGMTTPVSPPSHRLQMAYLYAKYQCRISNWNHFTCFASRTSSSCGGDSGGPLVINNELAGVSSFGVCQATGESGYTSVHKYTEWIEQQLQMYSFE